MKVFVGPTEIAGYYRNLCVGLRSVGVNCDYVVFNEHPFDYEGVEIRSGIVAIIKRLNSRAEKSASKSFYFSLMLLGFSECFKLIHFSVCLFRYDVFIFGFGKSLLINNIDLPILRFLGKRVIMNLAHGSESRPPYLDGAQSSPDGSFAPAPGSLAKRTAFIKKRNSFIEKYVSTIIGAPFSTTQLTTKCMINFFALGIPFHSAYNFSGLPGELSPVNSDQLDKSVVRILHSPSHPAAKGSAHIREAIATLKESGHLLEFVELQGASNRTVLEEIQRCDFVVDQIYSDTPMAGFAAEAAWFGKPAIVGGYGLEGLGQYVEESMFPPSLVCLPGNIVHNIETMVVDRRFREDLGARARSFVQSKWSAEKVAQRFKQLLDGDIPANWWLNPRDVAYLYGCGLTEEKVKSNIRQMVQAFGVGSLQLSHAPELERAFLEFADLQAV